MPNWIEGTLKVRGTREKILRFLNEGLVESYYIEPGDRGTKEEQVRNLTGDDPHDIHFEFYREPGIDGTRRSFVTSEELWMYFNDDKEIRVMCLNIKAAWGFVSCRDDVDAWASLSEKYGVDIKLYGIESGAEFCQTVIIINGREPIVNDKVYEDWDWECPFPNMGG